MIIAREWCVRASAARRLVLLAGAAALLLGTACATVPLDPPPVPRREGFVLRYRSVRSQKPLLISVDLEARRDERLPRRLTLGLELRNPDKDGLAEGVERQTLELLEGKLAEIARETRSASVGWLETDKVRLWIFYVAPGSDLPGRARNLLLSWNYMTLVQRDDDPEWRMYHRALYPSPAEGHSLDARAAAHARGRSGDDGTRPRPVTHELRFETLEARAAFEERVARRKFLVKGRSEIQGRDRPFALELERADPVTPEAIDAVVVELAKEAAGLGGGYVRWEADPLPFEPRPGSAPTSSRSP